MQTFDQWLIARLLFHGAYDGARDGAHGRSVILALERFQRAEQLPVTGKADTLTVAALRVEKKSATSGLVQYASGPAAPAAPVWMREARRFEGLKEISGAKSNSTIMGWAKRFGGWIAGYYTNDDIPWCGLFVGHVVAVTLPREKLPSNPLGALNWQSFGRQASPAVGAILVFKRTGGGHVGFYVGEDRTHYHVLGGNQSNAVNVSRIEKSRLVAVRWPTTGEPPVGGAVQMSASGTPVSKTEA
ncbi:MAG: TIGR02594 family protein [Stutzerimonas stutzeri]|nr:MAG: TIGR02594 family protein [Stutzerimonas stutzeri]